MTHRPFVKVCGLTRVEDALLAARLGVDFLGLVFYPRSPRAVEPEQALALVQAVRAVFGPAVWGGPRWVGVFVNAAVDEVRAVMARVGLDLAQLHGEEPPEAVAALEGRAFKALRPQGTDDPVLALAPQYAAAGPRDPNAPQLLVDAFSPAAYGGTGQPASWDAAASLAARYRVLLAGGLRPENLPQALEQVRPWGVDLSSGLERGPGRKDADRLQALARVLGLQPRDALSAPTTEEATA